MKLLPVRLRAWQQDSLRRDLKKPAANLGEFAGHFWSQIWDETYCFDKMDKESLGAVGCDMWVHRAFWCLGISSIARRKAATA